jgi:hypothetical protein
MGGDRPIEVGRLDDELYQPTRPSIASFYVCERVDDEAESLNLA